MENVTTTALGKIVEKLMDSYSPDQLRHHNFRNKIIAIKLGGNALTDDEVIDQIIAQIVVLNQLGLKPVVIHGGGIEIKELLKKVKLETEFIGGHRKTDLTSMGYIEMALSGKVNKELVRKIQLAGPKAVGISGKDGNLVIAKKRVHIDAVNDEQIEKDLGFVGDVEKVNPHIVHTLLDAGYIPVISPVSIGVDGNTYNINADMFAGHLAAAIQADSFVALTNIDGLLKDLDDPESLIQTLTPDACRKLYGTVINGGMIPKMDASLYAIENGVTQAQIINGTKPESLLRILLTKDKLGTILKMN